MQTHFLTLLVFLLASPYAFSQSGFVNEALNTCKKYGGDYQLQNLPDEGNKYCKEVVCFKSTNGESGIPSEVADGGGEANVAARKKVCVDKSKVDGLFDADASGSGKGKGSTSVVIGEDGDRNIYDEDGNIIGTQGGSISVNVGGSIGSRTLSSGDMCYDKCVRRGFLNIFGKKKLRLDKKSCKKCLEQTGRQVYSGGKAVGSVDLPDGVTIVGGSSSGGTGGVSGGGTVIIGGNGGGSWSGGNSGSGSRACTYIYSPDECYGASGGGSVIIQGGTHSSSGDCINCESNWKSRRNNGSVWNGIANLAGAIAGPLAYYGVNARWASAYQSGQQAWAGAAATGFEQCQLMQTNYVNSTYNYIQNNELQDRTVMPPECNGYQLGGFAGGMGFMGNGMGGFGNPWGAAGYSPGFTAGMYGPYGMYNPYGSGMGGGFGINLGMGMGYPGSMGMGMGYPGGMGMGMGYYPGSMGMGMGYPGSMGMGMGYPGSMGMGVGINFGYGMGSGMGGAMCFTSPCNVGSAGYGYWGSPGNYGMSPWGNGYGSYYNGTGGMGTYGGANFGNIQQSYMQNQQAAYQDSILAQMGGMSPWSTGYGQMGGNYGYAPYAPGNMGYGMSAGFGFSF